jgi:hypothetical protein
MGDTNNTGDNTGQSEILIGSLTDLLNVGMDKTNDVFKLLLQELLLQIKNVSVDIVDLLFTILVPTDRLNDKITLVFNEMSFPSDKYNQFILQVIRDELMYFVTPENLINMVIKFIANLKTYIMNIENIPLSLDIIQDIIFDVMKGVIDEFIDSLKEKLGDQFQTNETILIDAIKQMLESIIITEFPKITLKVLIALGLGETFAIPFVSGITNAVESTVTNITDLEVETIGKTAKVLGELLAKKYPDVNYEPKRGGNRQKKIEYKSIIRRIQSSIHAFRNMKSNNKTTKKIRR